MKKISVLLLAAAMLLAGCDNDKGDGGNDDPNTTGYEHVQAVLNAKAELSQFAGLFASAGGIDKDITITVFAVTNREAVTGSSPVGVDGVEFDGISAGNIKTHIVKGRLNLSEIEDGKPLTATALNGVSLTFERDGERVTINGEAAVTGMYITQGPSVVYVVDAAVPDPARKDDYVYLLTQVEEKHNSETEAHPKWLLKYADNGELISANSYINKGDDPESTPSWDKFKVVTFAEDADGNTVFSADDTKWGEMSYNDQGLPSGMTTDNHIYDGVTYVWEDAKLKNCSYTYLQTLYLHEYEYDTKGNLKKETWYKDGDEDKTIDLVWTWDTNPNFHRSIPVKFFLFAQEFAYGIISNLTISTPMYFSENNALGEDEDRYSYTFVAASPCPYPSIVENDWKDEDFSGVSSYYFKYTRFRKTK